MTATPHRRRLAAAALVLAATALTACSPDQTQSTQNNSTSNSGSSSDGDSGYGDAHVDKADYTIPQNVALVKLVGRAGSIKVIAGDGPISITETAVYSDDKPATTHAVDGSTLNLANTGCAKVRTINGRCQVAWEIHAPAGTNVDLNSNSGSIDLTGMSGTVSAVGDSGSIEAENLTSKTVTAKTDSGGVELAFTQVPDQVNATTDAGSVKIEVPGGVGYAVQAKTDAGSKRIKVQQDPASPHKINAETDAGSVEVENG
ncbi:DUF4097 family beta strand repeat-containing protein [Pseudonocardia spinosispora]|uniref:DUF4097 family beta strand repeat-containing protein n=1 Tax=Pseudonocardia spinosispora TaxID=103441 RepID=UPI0004185948|nr:DUF4097 family beta strand repeat-containing protein [Pseudonocardia spinosispora]